MTLDVWSPLTITCPSETVSRHVNGNSSGFAKVQRFCSYPSCAGSAFDNVALYIMPHVN